MTIMPGTREEEARLEWHAGWAKMFFLFSAERKMLTIWLFFVCVCGIQYDNMIWLYYVYMYIHRYRYVDSGVDRIWECPRIFTQIWNIWIHVWTCLNIHVLSTSGWWYFMIIWWYLRMWIKAPVPWTLNDIEIAGNSWMLMPTMAPGSKNTSQKMGLTSSNNRNLLNIGISTRNIGRLVSENDENMTVNRVSLQNLSLFPSTNPLNLVYF